jgi:hypothetical protein
MGTPEISFNIIIAREVTCAGIHVGTMELYYEYSNCWMIG